MPRIAVTADDASCERRRARRDSGRLSGAVRDDHDADPVAAGRVVRHQLDRLAQRLELLPEATDARPVSLVDVVERDQAPRGDERGEELEVPLHPLVGVIAVDEEEVDAPAAKLPADLVHGARILGIARDQELDALAL